MAPGVPAGLDGLLEVVGPSRTTPFNDLKRAAGRASWSAFRDQVAPADATGLAPAPVATPAQAPARPHPPVPRPVVTAWRNYEREAESLIAAAGIAA
jgi:hypothetical protein